MRFARLAGVGGFILGSFAAPAPKAVTLVDASPVVVAGSGYTAGARVLVSYRSGATQLRRRVTVTTAGRFRVVLKGVAFKRCNGLALTAAGASLRVPSCAAGGRPTVTATHTGRVSGSAFVPSEHIALSANAGALVLRASAAAGPNGAFSTQLPWPKQACANIAVHAVGALGSSATFTVAMPACRKP
jgi:hypothetical protein